MQSQRNGLTSMSRSGSHGLMQRRASYSRQIGSGGAECGRRRHCNAAGQAFMPEHLEGLRTAPAYYFDSRGYKIEPDL